MAIAGVFIVYYAIKKEANSSRQNLNCEQDVERNG
jgi:hypothetical protein